MNDLLVKETKYLTKSMTPQYTYLSMSQEVKAIKQ